jgi:aquaporin Z
MFNSKAFLAEFIGTFALVFVGLTATLVVNSNYVSLAVAYGLVAAAMVYVYGQISGAHLNPAVTFAFALNGTVKWLQAVFYWLAQFAGAVLGVFLLKTMLESLGGSVDSVVNVGALTAPQPVLGMVVEAVLAFLLVSAYLHVITDEKGGAFAGLAIGTTLSIVAVVGILFIGDIANPARTLAAAIFAGPSFKDVYTYVIYLFGPLLGSTLAVIVFNFLNDVQDVEDDDEGDDDDEDEEVVVVTEQS